MTDELNTNAGAGPVEQGVRPAAWIDASGHPRHLSYAQGVQERKLYGPLQPLYDAQTLWNACARAGDVEREKIKARLLSWHERDKHRHNYWACAVVVLFEPERLEPADKLAAFVRERQDKAQALIDAGKCPDCEGAGEWGGQFTGGVHSCDTCGGTGRA